MDKESLLNSILKKLEDQERLGSAVEKIKNAFELAYEAHKTQKRKSGDPYIIHPCAVAEILIDLQCDSPTVCAGLLHDVLEDTDVKAQELEEKFGKEVLELVEGVTKLGQLSSKSRKLESAQAANFRKMLLAISKDMRVVLVKLADRLHNMRTLKYLSEEKQKRIARETMDIFAPLAHRFGLASVKSDLQDLSFKYLMPEEFQTAQDFVQDRKTEREEQLDVVINRINELLEQNDIHAVVEGRAKHLYSVWNKINRQGNYDLFDLLGVRIIVRSVKECYQALGLVHDEFRPMPGRFKDYIAMPKNNMYQSLHTAVVGPFKKPVEIQIRTHEMHDIAEHGIAAHWHYKEVGGSKKAQDKDIEQLSWLRQLISWHTDLTDPEEYLDTVKADIFSQEVYILSPKGDVYTLPADSSPVDFAYRIHSDIGDTCTGAIVNEKIVPLEYKLQNGDLVEIIRNKNSHPNLGWLNFVKTNQAKHRIKLWYKKQNRDLHISVGRQLLEEEFGKSGIEQFLKSEEFLKAISKLNYTEADDFLAALGCGDNSVAQLKGRLASLSPQKSKSDFAQLGPNPKLSARKAPKAGDDAAIPDLDGLLYHIAKCCFPIPGEAVCGVVSKGRGITIHRADCKNLKLVDTERLMQINWSSKENKSFPASLRVEVLDRVGMVRDLLTLIADEGVNVRDFKVTQRPTDNTALLKMVLDVTGQDQLHKITQVINNMTDVMSVERT